ncbi:MAG: lipoate--protein ligase family protein [Caldilineales bacterium]|nr:lipoate--protein ligase family protein [Caldilineales bacterium]
MSSPYSTRSPWRLLITSPASGAWNMAVDEAIATLAARNGAAPTLRFYQWQPPTVSLGRHQSVSDVDAARIEALGYGLVRRSTGGRAILHTDELTYSIGGSQLDPHLAGPVLDTYNRLSEGLMLGLQRLGLDATKAPGGQRAGDDVSAVCFEVPSAYELCVGSYKIFGSAQSRRAGYVLQHGSLPLYGDVTRLVGLLALPDAEQEQLRNSLRLRAATVEQLMGRRVTFWEAATVLVDGLTSALEIDLDEGELSPDELDLARELEAEKFANPGWTNRI